MRISLKVITLICVIVGFSWSSVNSNVIHVPSDQPTIQAGINAAGVGDTVLIAAGTYTGAGNRNLSSSGETVLVVGQFGPDSTIIDAEGAYDGFNAVSSGTEIRGLTIRNGVRGINCGTASPTIDSNKFVSNSSYGIYIEPNGFPNLHSNTYSGNGYGIAVAGGNISIDGTWHNDNGEPYVVLGDLLLARKYLLNSLTIEPGVTVKFSNAVGLQIGYYSSLMDNGSGQLQAVGTPDSLITFTSLSGLTNGWDGVYFENRSGGGGGTMSYCVVEKAGQMGWGVGTNILCHWNSQPAISNCIIRNSSQYGLYLSGSSPTITGCTISENSIGIYCDNSAPIIHGGAIRNNRDYAIYLTNQSFPDLSGNTYSGNVNEAIAVAGGTMTVTGTWHNDNGEPYVVLGDVLVAWGWTTPTLTIEPGATVKFSNNTGLQIGYWNALADNGPGQLYAVGTPDSLITFTSLNGQSNGWDGIYFENRSGGGGGTMSYCVVEKAGQMGWGVGTNILCHWNSQPAISNCIIRNSSQYGLYLSGSSPTITGCTISENSIGIYCDNSAPIIRNTQIVDNDSFGVYCEGSSQPTIGNTSAYTCKLYGNGTYDVYLNTSNDVNARYNFWGTSDSLQIESRIFDKMDDGSKGRVHFSPWVALQRDVKTVSILAPTGIVPVDTVITPMAVVKNVGQSSETFPVIFKIGSFYCETTYVSTPLDSGKIDTLNFDPWTADTLTKSVTYATTCSTAFNGDMYPRNDAVHGIVTVSTGLEPVILTITPNSSGNMGSLTTIITGANFQEGAVVRLKKEGEPDIVVDSLFSPVLGPDSILAIFDLREATPGFWDLVVTNPDSTSARFSGGVSVQAEREGVSVDIVGRDQIRIGREETYWIRCMNHGNFDIDDAFLELRLFPGFELVRVESSDGQLLWDRDSIVNDHDQGRIMFPDDWAGVPDTILDAFLENSDIFWLPTLSPGKLAEFKITVFAPPSAFCVDGQNQIESPVLPAILVPVVWIGTKVGLTFTQHFVAQTIYVWLNPEDETVKEAIWNTLKVASRKTGEDWDPRKWMNLLKRSSDILKHWFKMILTPVDLFHTEFSQMLIKPLGYTPASDIGLEFKAKAEARGLTLQKLNSFNKLYFAFEAGLKIKEKIDMATSEWNALSYQHGKDVARVASRDPNDKAGPSGFGDSSFVLLDGQFHYMVFFENDSSATASAESIWIVDTLDANHDWNTMTIGEIYPVTADSNRPNYNPQVQFDSSTGVIRWLLADINLPPDTLPPSGEGWVSFTVLPKQELASGTQIQNIAGIKFDTNPWILAPMDSIPVFNSIDALPPSSQVSTLPDTQDYPTFEVRWSGKDDSLGSGIRGYTIYFSVDDGPYDIWIADTTDTSAIFTGEVDHKYCFYSIARDNVGHVEQRPDSADACTRTPSYMCGDCNVDHVVNIGDILCLINYLFKGGTPPQPLQAGDVNMDGLVDVGDVVYLINYLFKGGPPPCQPPMVVSAKVKPASAEVWLRSLPVKDEVVSIFLDAKFDVDVAGAQFKIEWNNEELELLKITPTTRTQKLQSYTSPKDGEVNLGIVDINGKELIKSGEGALIELRMKTKTDSLNLATLQIKQAILVDASARKLDVKILGKPDESNLPKEFSLSQNYPNPFNPQTVIQYALPRDCDVQITVYNILGQKVKTLMNEYQKAGYKRVEWDGKNDSGVESASGIYFYKIKAVEYTQSKKMVILK